MSKYPTLVNIKIKPDAVITRHYGSPKPLKEKLPFDGFLASKDTENHCWRFNFNGIPYSVDFKDVDINN